MERKVPWNDKMKKYKFLDEIKSDIMWEAYGKDLKELFANSAEALFSVICKVDKVKAKEVREVSVEGKDLSETLWNWLSALIAEVDVEEMFFSKFEIISVDEKHVKAKIYGSSIQPELGETVVKSLTNHRYNVEKNSKGYKATISVDI